jgi:hypothetical protein
MMRQPRYGPRFVIARSLRVNEAGVNTSALQEALDDVAVRHEVLAPVGATPSPRISKFTGLRRCHSRPRPSKRRGPVARCLRAETPYRGRAEFD